jgi:hypothetical protein
VLGATDAASPRLAILGGGVNNLKTIFATLLPLKMRLFAQRPILRSLGAQTLHEVDRLNLMLVI